jgi:hypothetical protein
MTAGANSERLADQSLAAFAHRPPTPMTERVPIRRTR